MPTLSLCSKTSLLSRFCFGSACLTTDGGARYSGDAGIAQLAALTDGMRVLLMIPGFNNSAANAQESFNTIVQNLTLRKMLGPESAYQIAIGMLWPGRTAAGYWMAEESARRSADKLREIVLKLRPASLSIEAHSLGNLVTLHANRDGGLGAKDLILCNAAVDDEAVEAGQTYFQAVSSIRGRCLVVSSRNDEVLGRDYRWLGSVPRNVWSWMERKGGGFGHAALGFSGPEHGRQLISANVVTLDATAWCPDHGAARSAPELYDAWERIITPLEKRAA